MTNARIARQRLLNQHLIPHAFKTPLEAVSWLTAVQGQDYPGARWSIGLRLPASSDAAVEQAIAEKSIVRSWILRGTLHIVAAQDLRWLVALVGPVMVRRHSSMYRRFELDAAAVARSIDIITTALEGGKQLIRKELADALVKNHISPAGQRMVHFLYRAALEGLICLGAPRGKQPTYVLLDEWLPETPVKDRDEGLAELARRYFASHGPATWKDYLWWSGLPAAEARAGLENAKADLVQETINGQVYWSAPGEPEGPAAAPVQLLPGFDEYLLGYTDRSAVLADAFFPYWTSGGGMFSSTIVVDGLVAGTWKRAFGKGGVRVSLNPLKSLSDSEQRAMVAAAGRYAGFLGLQLLG